MNNSTKTSYGSSLYISKKQPVIHLDPIFVYPDGVEEKIEKIRGNIIETMPKEKSFISKYGSEIAGTLFATETRIKLEGHNSAASRKIATDTIAKISEKMGKYAEIGLRALENSNTAKTAAAAKNFNAVKAFADSLAAAAANQADDAVKIV